MLISPFLKEASFCSQQRPLLKATISQNAKDNWPWGAHPQLIHLQHKLLHLRLREHLRGRKTIIAIGPERYHVFYTTGELYTGTLNCCLNKAWKKKTLGGGEGSGTCNQNILYEEIYIFNRRKRMTRPNTWQYQQIYGGLTTFQPQWRATDKPWDKCWERENWPSLRMRPL